MGVVDYRVTDQEISEWPGWLPTPLGWFAADSGEVRNYRRPELIGRRALVMPGDASGCPGFLEWARRDVTAALPVLRAVLRAALLRTGGARRLVVRADLEWGNIHGLQAVAERVAGGLCTRLRKVQWQCWPDQSWKSDTQQLAGARLAFLPALERWERFPQMAAARLVAAVKNGWFDLGGGCWVRMPEALFYPGVLRKVERLDELLGRDIQFLQPPEKGVNLAPPMDWLEEEAAAILGWMITEADA